MQPSNFVLYCVLTYFYECDSNILNQYLNLCWYAYVKKKVNEKLVLDANQVRTLHKNQMRCKKKVTLSWDNFSRALALKTDHGKSTVLQHN